MSELSHTTACVFNDAMQTLWPDTVKFDNLLSLVTVTVHYTKKAAEDFQ
jgi:hypothetical protein